MLNYQLRLLDITQNTLHHQRWHQILNFHATSLLQSTRKAYHCYNRIIIMSEIKVCEFIMRDKLKIFRGGTVIVTAFDDAIIA